MPFGIFAIAQKVCSEINDNIFNNFIFTIYRHLLKTFCFQLELFFDKYNLKFQNIYRVILYFCNKKNSKINTT